MHGVDGNESDAEIFVEVLVGGNVAASSLEVHFHIQLAAFADSGDVNVFVEHFDIGIGLDHARGHNSRLVGAQVDRFRGISAQFERDLLQVQDDISRVFHDARDRLELVQHPFDLHRGNGGAFNGAQQHAAKRVADGSSETALKRLRPENSVFIGEG